MMHDLDRVIVSLCSQADFLSEVSTLLEIAQDYLEDSDESSQLKIKVVVDEAQGRLECIIDDLGYYNRVMVSALVMFGAVASGVADRTHQQTTGGAND